MLFTLNPLKRVQLRNIYLWLSTVMPEMIKVPRSTSWIAVMTGFKVSFVLTVVITTSSRDKAS